MLTKEGERIAPPTRSRDSPGISQGSARDQDWRIDLALLVAFACFVAIGLWRHEMWRDELQPWMIARDSSNFAELFRNLRYDGHPGLWYLCLFVVSRFTRNPHAMQVLHLALATLAAWFLLRGWPAPRAMRAAATFGYFTAWEYAVVSRGYVLGEVLLFAFCRSALRGRAHVVSSALLLAALAYTSVYGTLLAIVFGAWLIADASWANSARVSRYRSLLACTIIAFGLAVAAVQMRPPSDALDESRHWNASIDVARAIEVLATTWRAFVPIVDFTRTDWWNTNVLLDGWKSGAARDAATVVAAILGVGIVTYLSLRLPKSRGLRKVFVLGTMLLLAFSYVKILGSARHHGHLWLLWMAVAWLGAGGRAEAQPALHASARPSGVIVSALLAIHTAVGFAAWSRDLFQPFSTAPAVASMLRRLNLDASVPLGGSTDWSVLGVSAYLDRPLWHLETERLRTFVIWDNRRKGVTPRAAFPELWRLSQGRPAVLILDRPFAVIEDGTVRFITSFDHPDGFHAERLAAFSGAVVRDENFQVYVIVPQQGQPTGAWPVDPR